MQITADDAPVLNNITNFRRRCCIDIFPLKNVLLHYICNRVYLPFRRAEIEPHIYICMASRNKSHFDIAKKEQLVAPLPRLSFMVSHILFLPLFINSYWWSSETDQLKIQNKTRELIQLLLTKDKKNFQQWNEYNVQEGWFLNKFSYSSIQVIHRHRNSGLSHINCSCHIFTPITSCSLYLSCYSLAFT